MTSTNITITNTPVTAKTDRQKSRGLGIILMSRRVTEVDQQPITEVFRQVSLEAGNDGGTSFLVGAHDLAQFFGIELL